MHTLHTHYDIADVGAEQVLKLFGTGRDFFMNKDITCLVDNADVK